MTKAAHTSGPWFAGPPISGWRDVGVRTGNRLLAIVTDQGCDDDDVVEANARLIAAAPDLLDAARTGLRWIEGWMEARQYPETAEEWCSLHDECEPDSVYAQRDRVRAAIAKAEGGGL